MRRKLFIAIPLLAVLFALWLGGREATLQWAAQRAAAASGGALSISGVRGSLYGTMHVGRLQYRSPERSIVAERAELRWAPWQLLRGRIDIGRLHLAQLTVEILKPSGAPLTLPQTLAAPLPVSIDALQVDQIAIIAQGAHNEIANLHLRLSGNNKQWQLQDAHAETIAGRLDAALTLDAQRPFTLGGTLNLTRVDAKDKAWSKTAITGNLSAVLLTANFDAYGASGQGNAVLTPFDAFMLRSLQINAQRIDPAQFQAGLPQADLRIELLAQVGPEQALSGQLTLENRMAAGTLDRQRLPLRSLAAQLRGKPDALRLDDLALDFGVAGKLSGQASLNDGLATLALHTNSINLKALHARLRTSAIAGDITLSNPGGIPTLRAALGQDRLHLALHATMAEQKLQLHDASLRAGSSSARLSGAIDLAQPQRFKLNGMLKRFNPAEFGAYPAADLNAGLELAGQLQPDWQVATRFAFQPSRLFGQPLLGRGTLSADATHVREVDASLALGGNKIGAQGNFGRPGEHLALQLDARNLALLHAGLAGALRAEASLSGDIDAPLLRFDASAQGLHLNQIGKGNPDSRLQARGELTLRGAGPFSVKAALNKINPAALGDYPRGSISGVLDASGKIGRNWQAALDFTLKPSVLLDAALSGHGQLHFDPTRIAHADVALQLAQNTLALTGSLGAAQDRLQWRIDAPQLAALGPQFGGAVKGQGGLSGTRDALQLDLALDGSDLTLFGQHHARRLHASARIGPGERAVLQADISASGLRSDQQTLQALRLQADGTRLAHTLKLSASNPDLDLQAELAGGWRAQQGWDGVLRSLQNRGRLAFALQAPAPLHLGADRIALKNLALQLPNGSISVQTLEKTGPRWQTRGQAAGVPLAYLAPFSETLRDKLDSSLILGADWSLAARQAIDGRLRIFRERGDLTLRGATPLALGLTEFEASAEIAKNALQIKFDMAGARAGSVRLAAATQLARTDRGWRLPPQSALRLNADASLPTLAWLAPLSGKSGLELDGSLAVALAGSGTLGAPQLSGQVNGDKLGLRWPEQGVKLRNGVLRAQLRGDQLQLQQLRFDGEQGTLRVDGSARLADAQASLDMTLVADRLRLLSRPDRQLDLSGQGRLSLDKNRLLVDGKLQVEQARFELRERDGPTRSDDVVVLGRADRNAVKEKPLPFRIDLDIDLGQQFYLKGQGLDAQLAGNLRLRSSAERLPRASGTIRVVQGSYAAYGQRLQIERGTLGFGGPLDNPGLNILAVRKVPQADDAVEAGVEIRGTALAPSARLVSTPNVPDSEKLSWLVLGRGTEGAGSRDFDALAAAASALFGSKQGASLQARLANTIGLDQFGIAHAKGLESTVLTLGKRISQRAYLSYEQGVSGATSLVKLRYALNKRLTLEAQAGTSSALDLMFNWSFD
ncbi:MAG TPA: translocation/assembly module TamB domain-containing protein [Paucimonas sp.]|nr:translocation/assembly module TamB domain-containing protein [Paucimonas sp.]